MTPLDQERSTEVAAAIAELLQPHGYQEMSEHRDIEALTAFLAEEPQTDVQARLSPENMEFYACGINAMVYSLVTTIEKLGVPEESIQLEGYG